MPVGAVVENCFVNSKGRLVDVVRQYQLEQDRWMLMSAHEEPSTLMGWLEKYWFAEKISVSSLNDNPGFELIRLSEEQRIARGLPKASNEICESNNPFELRLDKLISWNKGCYIGQEVISRLNTYDKVSRILVAFRCAQEDFEALRASPEVSSMVSEFESDGPVALAIVKKTALTEDGFMTTQNGTKVWVVSSAR